MGAWRAGKGGQGTRWGLARLRSMLCGLSAGCLPDAGPCGPPTHPTPTPHQVQAAELTLGSSMWVALQ